MASPLLTLASGARFGGRAVRLGGPAVMAAPMQVRCNGTPRARPPPSSAYSTSPSHQRHPARPCSTYPPLDSTRSLGTVPGIVPNAAGDDAVRATAGGQPNKRSAEEDRTLTGINSHLHDRSPSLSKRSCYPLPPARPRPPAPAPNHVIPPPNRGHGSIGRTTPRLPGDERSCP